MRWGPSRTWLLSLKKAAAAGKQAGTGKGQPYVPDAKALGASMATMILPIQGNFHATIVPHNSEKEVGMAKKEDRQQLVYPLEKPYFMRFSN